MKTGDVIGE